MKYFKLHDSNLTFPFLNFYSIYTVRMQKFVCLCSHILLSNCFLCVEIISPTILQKSQIQELCVTPLLFFPLNLLHFEVHKIINWFGWDVNHLSPELKEFEVWIKEASVHEKLIRLVAKKGYKGLFWNFCSRALKLN